MLEVEKEKFYKEGFQFEKTGVILWAATSENTTSKHMRSTYAQISLHIPELSLRHLLCVDIFYSTQ